MNQIISALVAAVLLALGVSTASAESSQPCHRTDTFVVHEHRTSQRYVFDHYRHYYDGDRAVWRKVPGVERRAVRYSKWVCKGTESERTTQSNWHFESTDGVFYPAEALRRQPPRDAQVI